MYLTISPKINKVSYFKDTWNIVYFIMCQNFYILNRNIETKRHLEDLMTNCWGTFLIKKERVIERTIEVKLKMKSDDSILLTITRTPRRSISIFSAISWGTPRRDSWWTINRFLLSVSVTTTNIIIIVFFLKI